LLTAILLFSCALPRQPLLFFNHTRPTTPFLLLLLALLSLSTSLTCSFQFVCSATCTFERGDGTARLIDANLPNAMSARSAEEVRFLIHHVVLPPKLPQAADSDPHLERVLLDTAAETLEKLYGTVAANHTRAAQRVASVRLAIRNLINSRADSGYVAESQLATLLHSVASGVAPGALPLEIKAQNAGIVVSKLGTNVTFEVFELSPLNEIVMGTTGRLVRSFPAYACRIPAFALLEKGLIEALSYGIAKMSVQEVPEFRPQVRKAKKDLAEIRNTMHPGLVTDYLVNVLAALGQSVDVHAISKNTRDDVLWCDAFQPWRRSPLWLLARVAMQLEFARDGADRDGNNLSAFPSLFSAIAASAGTKFLQIQGCHGQPAGRGARHGQTTLCPYWPGSTALCRGKVGSPP
jgi:hypothetical protein